MTVSTKGNKGTIGATTYRRPCPSWPRICGENDDLDKAAARNDARPSDLNFDAVNGCRVHELCTEPSNLAESLFSADLQEARGEDEK